MKFKPNHLASLTECVKEVFSSLGKTYTELKAEPEHKDKSETRIVWDIFWASGWSTKFRAHYNEGDYCDSHIQTALKHILKSF